MMTKSRSIAAAKKIGAILLCGVVFWISTGLIISRSDAVAASKTVIRHHRKVEECTGINPEVTFSWLDACFMSKTSTYGTATFVLKVLGNRMAAKVDINMIFEGNTWTIRSATLHCGSDSSIDLIQ